MGGKAEIGVAVKHPSFRCDRCSKTFRSHKLLSSHKTVCGQANDFVNCHACKSAFSTRQGLEVHAAYCNKIAAMERHIKCEFCDLVLPESRCLYHEVSCQQNPNRMVDFHTPMTEKVKCKECGSKVANGRTFRYHLSRCLPVLRDQTMLSMNKCGYTKRYYNKNREKNPSLQERQVKKLKVDSSADEGIKDIVVSLDDIIVPVEVNEPKQEEEVQHLQPEVEEDFFDITDDKAVAERIAKIRQEQGSVERGFFVCVFCKKTFTQIKGLKHHAAECFRINRLEAVRQCCHCQEGMPESKSIFHEFLCSRNPKRKTDKLTKTSKIDCPRCYKKIHLNSYLKHLSYCLEQLRQFTHLNLKHNGVPEEVFKDRDDKKRRSAEILPECFFCQEKFLRVDILRRHAAVCPIVPQFETRKQCRHCGQDFSFSQCQIHEFVCMKNDQNLVKLERSNAERKRLFVFCPNCKGKLRYGSFPRHLSMCLPTMEAFTEKSVMEYERRAKMAGLTLVPTEIKKPRKNQPSAPKRRPACMHCSKTFDNVDSLKDHAAFCLVIQEREEQRECQFCKESFGESSSYLHEFMCVKNVNGLADLDEDIIRPEDVTVMCFVCTDTLTFGCLQPHLSRCMPSMKAATAKSVEMFDTLSAEDSTSMNEENGDTIRSCHFCNAKFASIASLTIHPATCRAIQLMERKRKCRYCKVAMAKSLSYLHEVTCFTNPNRKRESQSDDNLISCANCDKPFAYNSYSHHLSVCLDHLSVYTRISIQGVAAVNESNKIKTSASATKTKSMTTKLKIQNSGQKSVPRCVYCNKTFAELHSLKTHAAGCHIINSLEKKLACEFCQEEMAESRCLIHELSCSRNPDRLDGDTYSSRKKSTILCKKCGETCNYDYYSKHLSSCLPELLEFTHKSFLACGYKCVDDNMDTYDVIDGKILNLDPADIILDKDSGSDEEAENDTKVNCPFCDKFFATREGLEQHPVFCKSMKIYEPEKVCQKCSLELPVSLHGLHEMQCGRGSINVDKLFTVELNCPECSEEMVASDLPKHLSQCLEILQTLLDEGPSNNENIVITNFDESKIWSGLQDWLKLSEDQ